MEKNILCQLIAEGKNTEAKKIIEEGYNVNLVDITREKLFYVLTQGAVLEETPLIAACKSGNVEMINYLLDNGANPNITNYGMETPIIYYLEKFYYLDESLVKKFIEKGADINIGVSITPVAALMSHYYKAEPDSRRIIERELITLLEAGAEWVNTLRNSRYQGDSVLHFVASTNELEFMELLFKYNQADECIIKENAFGYTPKKMAEINEQKDMYDLLVGRGA